MIKGGVFGLTRERTRDAAISAVVITVIVFAGVWGLRSAGGLEQFELTAYDLLLRLLPTDDRFASEIVIVGIDDEDIEQLGHPSLTDGEVADLLQRVLDFEPRAIGLDIFRDLRDRPGQERLAQVLLDNPHITAAWAFADGAYGVLPPAVLADLPDYLGFTDEMVDPDGVMRRVLIIIEDEEQDISLSSLEFQLAWTYLDGEDILPAFDESDPNVLHVGATTYRAIESGHGGYVGEDAGGFQFMLDYRGGQNFKTFSMREVMAGDVGPEFRDKVVVIGNTDPIAKDYIATPMNELEFGVRVQAIQLEHLIRGALAGAWPPAAWPDAGEALWTLAWALVGAILGMAVRSPWRFCAAVAGGLALLSVIAWLGLVNGLWLALVPPALTWSGSAAVSVSWLSYTEQRDRVAWKTLFEKNVAPEVAWAIWNQRETILKDGRVPGHQVAATVLFTDLVGFTKLSETLPPQALMDWLNEYMASMTAIIIEQGGVINKFVGDSILALYGVPIPRESDEEIREDARNAIRTALSMRSALRRLNDTWKRDDRPTVSMRIGIFSGPLVVGTVGGRDRLEYTVIGDTVNTASRLEGYDSSLMDPDIAVDRSRILIGGPTLELVGDGFVTRHIGKIALKGKTMPIDIHSVLGNGSAPADHDERGHDGP